jgi:mannose-6-phosphate isomerase-like protein (cupin superfamily)
MYTKTAYDSVEPKAPGMHFLRDALDCENLGVTVLDAGADWEGMEHDHADQDHEEVYVLLSGSGQITVDGETVSLEAGDAVRVAPGATRALSFDAESQMVIAGAP